MRFPKRSETFAQIETRALKKLGHDVSVYTLHPEKPEDESGLESTGITPSQLYRPVARVSLADMVLVLRHAPLAMRLVWVLLRTCWRTPRHFAKAVVLLPAAVGVFSQLMKDKPSVVHLFWGHYPALVGWLWLAANPKHRLSMFLGAYDLMYKFPLSRVVGRNLQFEGRGLVFTHAKANLQAIDDFGLDSSQVVVSYRSVDMSQLKLAPGSKVPRRVFSAGRLIPEKGMATLVQAFSRVVAQYPDATLVIAGDGPQKPYLIKLTEQLGITSLVSFPGHLPQPVLFAQLSSADVFALMSSSWSERLPNVVKEAMALGVHPLVQESPGMFELIPSPVLGTVLQNASEQAVSQALLDIFEAESSAEQLAQVQQERRAFIQKHFDASAIMVQRCELWQACLNEPASRGFQNQ